MNDADREEIEALIRIAVPRVFRDRTDPLEILDDIHFRERFRLSRNGFYYVLSLIRDDLAPQTIRSASLTSAQKFAVFLETIGSDNLQRVSGVTLGCSQPTVSRIIAEVSDLFYRRRREFISWPTQEQQRVMKRSRSANYNCNNFFLVRKDYHSINMGAIADLDQRFIWISVKFPGRAHDSRVFRSSQLYRDLCTGRKKGVLLADSAYRSEKFLLKPILTETRTEAEGRYTRALCKGRAIIEHAFGSLKRQFQSLHTELRYAFKTHILPRKFFIQA
ncbi:transposase, IS4 family [Ancylostoma caninum]|uniref:Transposase, IS4 family n=1 Tax=Ancylostoma caninum TaxID=29170 RepID=A0A368F1J7_ANCCA|nr:transposase, IS4 family [Ancylostoma caninum]